jgi:hypothetical protein
MHVIVTLNGMDVVLYTQQNRLVSGIFTDWVKDYCERIN